MSKLLAFLREATPAERQELAEAASTSVGYLYQLAGKAENRRVPRVNLAVSIERKTKELHERSAGRLPVVLVEDLAEV